MGGRSFASRFSNDLRYRDGDDPAQTQFTPDYVLSPVRFDLILATHSSGVNSQPMIWLDPCTTPDNPVRASRFFTPEDDGLAMPWCSVLGDITCQTIYVNPPYGKAREPWVERCIEAAHRGQPVILLIPAATDTRIWQKAVDTADAVVFVKGRVKFGVLRPNRRQVAASHPSSLIGWHTDLANCSRLGLRMAGSKSVARKVAA